MTDALKVLGQSAPSATTETDLYTVPASTQTVVSTVLVCNRSAVQVTFRISVSVGGGATANKDYLFYDVPLAPNDSYSFTIGLALSATDKIRVYASTADLSFNVFGIERT